MKMPAWEDLPPDMQTEAVRPYYDVLVARGPQLMLKRVLDVLGAALLLVALSWLFVLLAVAIKIDSPGPVFFRQRRVTQFGEEFRIFKFRTMTHQSQNLGARVTVSNDPRVTRVGAVIRHYRIDEIGQLIDVLRGTMTFVGTRLEIPEYVRDYTPEMRATLLLPAGVTSTASIWFKDEAEQLSAALDIDEAYLNQVLPAKMAFNLDDVRRFTVARELRIAFDTVRAVLAPPSPQPSVVVSGEMAG